MLVKVLQTLVKRMLLSVKGVQNAPQRPNSTHLLPRRWNGMRPSQILYLHRASCFH